MPLLSFFPRCLLYIDLDPSCCLFLPAYTAGGCYHRGLLSAGITYFDGLNIKGSGRINYYKLLHFINCVNFRLFQIVQKMHQNYVFE